MTFLRFMMLITPVAQKQEKHHLLHCDSSTVPFQIYKSQSHGTQGDRFIPTRSAINFEVANFTLTRQVEESSLSTLSVASPPKALAGGNCPPMVTIQNPMDSLVIKLEYRNISLNTKVRCPPELGIQGYEEYKKKLAEALLHDSSGKRAKILAFKRKPKTSSGFGQHFLLDELFSDECSAVQKYYRHVPQSAERILDAPDMVDDYYLNLLDWSCNDVVAIALGSTAYLWDAESGKIEQIMQANNEGDYLTSIAWAEDGKHISIGLNSSEVQLWDTMRMCRVRKMGGHSSRVGSLAWNGQILSSGSRDSLIINHDGRGIFSGLS
eukprot:Gb_04004 [translate_table: standard]